MLAVSWQEGGVQGGGGVYLGGKEGGACGSCKMPTGSHYTWVLSGSFRAPKNFLPLNGAFGKREVHWNHKQTQEESENQRGGGWKREKMGGVGGGKSKREITPGSTQQQLRKRKFKVRTMWTTAWSFTTWLETAVCTETEGSKGNQIKACVVITTTALFMTQE